MWTSVKPYVMRCMKRTLRNVYHNPAGKIQQLTIHPKKMLGVDIMGQLPRSSHIHEYLLVFVDYYFLWVELFPLRNSTAQTVVSHLAEEILTLWGT